MIERDSRTRRPSASFPLREEHVCCVAGQDFRSEDVAWRTPARNRFKMTFEFFCNRSVGQCDISDNSPRLEFVRVDRFPGVVLTQTILQISRRADVRLTAFKARFASLANLAIL